MRPLVIILLILLFGNAALAQDPNAHVTTGSDTLRLRAGPGLNFATLALLADHTPLLITGRNADSDWLEVVTTNLHLTGWVSAAYVDASIDLDGIPIHGDTLNFSNLISGIGSESRRIFALGQTMGNRPDVFAKVGDSITVSTHFLYAIGEGNYRLGDYSTLQPAIDYFMAGPMNSFTRDSEAAGVGWTAAQVLKPLSSRSGRCAAGEMPLRCEYRLTQPAFALIMFGTNDSGWISPDVFRHNMQRIIEITSELGIVPVLSTIPPRPGYDDQVAAYNQVIRSLSNEYQIPLLDYGQAMSIYMPYSLAADGVHPSLPPRGTVNSASFLPQNMFAGYVLRNLSALHLLDQLWREVVLYDDRSA